LTGFTEHDSVPWTRRMAAEGHAVTAGGELHAPGGQEWLNRGHVPLIAVATLGGTISMAPVDGGGAVPRFGAAELLGGLGDLPMDVLAETLARIGCASLGFARTPKGWLSWRSRPAG
jgi:L-asparaginase/Glu-tRNA(Gln) amidotransferase subunit D